MWLFDNVLMALFTCYYWIPVELAVVNRIPYRKIASDNPVQLIENDSNHGQNDSKITDVRFVNDDFNNTFLSGKVVFPDAEIKKDYLYSPNCHHSHYCENMGSYPHHHLTTILSSSKNLDVFFGVDEEPIENRIGEPGETYLCASIQRVIFPQALKNRYNDWKFVVNQGAKYRQGVRIETCVERQQGCKFVDPPYGYITTCTQKYSYRRMLSVSESGDPEGDVFILPTACCCSYKRSLDL